MQLVTVSPNFHDRGDPAMPDLDNRDTEAGLIQEGREKTNTFFLPLQPRFVCIKTYIIYIYLEKIYSE